MVTWIVGLAGSGKTTLGTALVARLRASGRPAVLLDGDAVRAVFGDDLGHAIEDRRANGRRIAALCRLLDGQGIEVVACVLAIDPAQLAANRTAFGRYLEVFLDPPWSVLEARDQKGLYSGARDGRIRDVVGVDIPFLPPVAPDLVLGRGGGEGTADGRQAVEGWVDQVMDRLVDSRVADPSPVGR